MEKIPNLVDVGFGEIVTRSAARVAKRVADKYWNPSDAGEVTVGYFAGRAEIESPYGGDPYTMYYLATTLPDSPDFLEISVVGTIALRREVEGLDLRLGDKIRVEFCGKHGRVKLWKVAFVESK